MCPHECASRREARRHPACREPRAAGLLTRRPRACFVNSRRTSPPPGAPELAEALQRSRLPAPSAGPAAPRPPRRGRGSRLGAQVPLRHPPQRRTPSKWDQLPSVTDSHMPYRASHHLRGPAEGSGLAPPTPPCSPYPPPPPHILPPTPRAQNLKPTPKRREGGRGSRIEILQKHLQNKASDLAGGWTGRVGTPRSGRFPSSFFFFKIHVICVFGGTKKHNKKNPKRPGLPSRVERRWRQVEFGSAGAPAHAAFH